MAKDKAGQSVVMALGKKCKSCVRFEAKGDDGEKVAASLYLQNAAFEALGKPESITVTVDKA